MLTTPEELEALHHVYIGPTWARDTDGAWMLPSRTLGWQIAAWTADYLLAEDGGPWKFTLEQLRFVLWWYAVDDTGRFVYRKGVLQRMKGWGKDPLLAVLCLVELVGPSRFSHFDANGDPVGKSHPQAWVQVTAVNQSQTTNTMSLIPSLMSPLFITTYDIQPGAEIIRADGGRKRLVAVTSNFRSLEGGRTTFTLLNETHHWIKGNGGIKLYETIDGNATKIATARYLAITNAYLPGEDSVAEKMRGSYEKMAQGFAANVGFLYDSIEAHPETPLTPDALRIVLPVIRGDAVWLDIENIISSVLDGDMSPSRSRRMWLNQIVASEDAMYSPSDWDELEDSHLHLVPSDKIVMGFDGGKTDDGTALVAIRVSDQAAFLLGYWQRDETHGKGEWEVPRREVDEIVRDAFYTYDVQAFYADVALWESYIDEWAESFRDELTVKASEKHSIGWDMRQSLQKVTFAHERLVSTILQGKITHDGNVLMRAHVLNVIRHENHYGVSFRKDSRESPRKVDIYAALLLASEALHDLRTRGKKQKVRTGQGWFF